MQCTCQQCQTYVEFEEKVQEGTENANRFWQYIGRVLKSIKQQTHAVATSPAHATQLMNRCVIPTLGTYLAGNSLILDSVFVHALAAHRAKYPTQSAVGPMGDRPAWQSTLETVMDMGARI
jgi:hypothetical protein